MFSSLKVLSVKVSRNSSMVTIMEKVSRKEFLRISSSAVVLSQLWGLSGCTKSSDQDGPWKNFDTETANLLEKIWKTYVGGDLAAARLGEDGLKKIWHECTLSLDTMLESFKLDAKYIVDDFFLALKVIDYGPIVFGWYGKSFVSLSSPEQHEVLESWLDSSLKPLRDISYGLKGLFTLLYYENSQVKELIEFDKPWVPRSRIQGARLGL